MRKIYAQTNLKLNVEAWSNLPLRTGNFSYVGQKNSKHGSGYPFGKKYSFETITLGFNVYTR